MNQKEWVRYWTNILKENGCSECGYIGNSRYLHFHHIIKEEQLFHIHGMSFVHKTNEEIAEEIGKCMLLCHKCHGKYTRMDEK